MSVDPPGHVERLEFDARPECARAARRFTAEVLEHAASEEIIDIALLLVSELATNALRHAIPPYALTVAVDLPMIEIAVEDGLHQPPMRRHPAEMDESGRGLVLVTELASAWGVRPLVTGKSTWFVLHADAGAAPPV